MEKCVNAGYVKQYEIFEHPVETSSGISIVLVVYDPARGSSKDMIARKAGARIAEVDGLIIEEADTKLSRRAAQKAQTPRQRIGDAAVFKTDALLAPTG